MKNDFIITLKDGDDKEKIPTRIIRSLTYNRVKSNKPCVVLVTGESGSGKSWFVQKTVDELYCFEGKIDYANFVEQTTVITPFEYANKLKEILYSKELKHCFCIIIDEARVVVGSDAWNTFVNHTIAHVNAMSRAVKPLCVFIITQNIKDIDASTRRTINYEFKVRRFFSSKPIVYPFHYWVNDVDVENPKLCRRRVFGLVKDGNDSFHIKPFFVVKKPRDEILQVYEKIMYEGKVKLLDNKMNSLIEKFKKMTPELYYSKITKIFNDLVANPDILVEWGRVKRGKWCIDPDKAIAYDLDKYSKKELEKLLTDYFKMKNSPNNNESVVVD
ncbi:MAG: ATP-binding protein [Candidatus Diapherotrites archaeon]